MRRLGSWLLLIPYAISWLVGTLVLVAVLIWLAMCDGYAAGRRKQL